MFDIDNINKPVNLSEGEWVGDIPDHPGVRFKVRSRNYKPFTAAHDKLLRSFGRRVSNAMSTPEYQKGLGELLTEHILLDWEDAVKKDGKPADYDHGLALEILTSVDDRGVGRTFRDAVAYAAGVIADRHLGIGEDAAGN